MLRRYIRSQPRGLPIVGHTSITSSSNERPEELLPTGYVFAYPEDDPTEIFGDWSPFTWMGGVDDTREEIVTFEGANEFDPGDYEGVAVRPIRIIRRESKLDWLARQATSGDPDTRRQALDTLEEAGYELVPDEDL